MNKTFMLLNDNTIEITNEKGVEINRGKFENNNVKGILLAENKIEIIDRFKKSFDKEMIEIKKILNISKNMLKLQVFLIVASPIYGFLFGAISNPSTWINNGIYESINAIAGSIFPVATATVYWAAIIPKYRKNIRELEVLINKGEEIRKESGKELVEEKNKTSNNTLELLVKVSLEEETNAIKEQLADELLKSFDENIKQRGKIRVRKK